MQENLENPNSLMELQSEPSSHSDPAQSEQVFPFTFPLKEISKKSAFLMLCYGIPAVGEILQAYLFSQFGLPSLAASKLISTIQKFVMDASLTVPDQSAVFISEIFGKIKLMKALEEENLIGNEFELDIEQAQKKVGNILRHAWYLGGIISVPCMATLFTSGFILQFLGVPKDVSDIVQSFFIPAGFAVPFMMTANINERFLPAVDQEIWLVPYRIAVAFLDIGLNLTLIPLFGATGAGLVVLTEAILCCVGSLLFIGLLKEFKPFQLFDFKYNAENYLKKIFLQGLPSSASLLVFRGVNFTLSIFLSRLGNLRLAIEQMASRVLWLPMMFSYGISQAVNRLVAQSLGEKHYLLLRQYGNLGLLFSSLLFSLIAIGCNVVPLWIASFFMEPSEITDSQSMIRYTVLIVSLTKLFGVIIDSTSLSLSALEDTLLSSAIGLITTVGITLPLSAMSIFLTNFDIYGIDASIGIGFLIAAITTGVYWFKISHQIVQKNDFDSERETSNVKFFALASSISFFKKCCSKGTQETNTEVKEELLMLENK